MLKINLIGNPNVGKTTLFNTLTKSDEHTGNFHGVTVEEKSKIISIENTQYEVVDLPGIYSINTFTPEEDVTKQAIIKNDAINFVVCDCNSLRKNLYLCLQLNELGIKYKILLNNYDYFLKKKNKLNVKKLQEKLNIDTEIINAKKTRLNNSILKINKLNINKNNYLLYFINKVKNKFNLNDNEIINAFNGIFNNLNSEQIAYIKSLNEELITERYNYIDNMLNDCLELEKSYVYGYSKLDKLLLNPLVMSVLFLSFFFTSVYAIFFLFGPILTDKLILLFEFVVVNPLNNLLVMITDNVWLIEFLNGGVFSSVSTILSFLPQVCLMFVFISILEDSGLISRMAYVFDDFLSKLGLNGKAIYIILLGLGCNTMSTLATRSINGKNLRIKSALLNPYISCMARLPVYVIIASTFFGTLSYLVIVGIYLLGLLIAFVLAYILNKTILKTQSGELLLEFPPLRGLDFKHILVVAIKNGKDMLKRVFGVVLSVGIIVWILTHTKYNLSYTADITNSVLYSICGVLSFVFAPIGLNNVGIVTALIVGIMAKELILSTFCITNNVANNTQLMSSLLLSTSIINFSLPSAVSFLIFSSLYCPCISNLAVLKKETNSFLMWFGVISQFTVAYMLSFVVYQGLTKGWLFASISVIVIAIIMFAIMFFAKKIRQGKCLTCGKCK